MRHIKLFRRQSARPTNTLSAPPGSHSPPLFVRGSTRALKLLGGPRGRAVVAMPCCAGTVNLGGAWRGRPGRVGGRYDIHRQVTLCRRPLSRRVISHAVWLYFRFPLSLRMVEERLAARGIDVSHETVRQWAPNLTRHAHARAARPHTAVLDREGQTRPPLPHRPPLPTSDTLQTPSNLAGSAKAGPDRITPVVRASEARAFFNISDLSPVPV